MYGLIFDVDGVLADSESIIAQATIKMFHDLYEVDLVPQDFHPYIGTGAVRYVQGPAEDHGVAIDIKQAVAVRHENFVALLESGVDIALPGTHALMDAAADSPGWRLGIATSSPHEKSRATLQAARVDLEKFDAYIHGDLITHKKPDPEIYLKAAETLGLCPASCVVVEDAVTGVASGKAAGMKVIAVTNSFATPLLAEADLIVDSLQGVSLDTLEGLLAHS